MPKKCHERLTWAKNCTCVQNRFFLKLGFQQRSPMSERMRTFNNRRRDGQTEGRTQIWRVKVLVRKVVASKGMCAFAIPWAVVMGAIFFFLSLSMVSLSSLKSSFVPTSIIGACGTWWFTSGNHFARTFSYDAGLVREKHTRNTSVCG